MQLTSDIQTEIEITFDSTNAAIQQYFNALKNLRQQQIMINSHSFTNQIGEWLVEILFDGKRAPNGQKGWDVDVNGKHIQVKTHAKAETNPTSFSNVSKCDKEQIDELIIIVFTHDYKLKNFFIVPWYVACPLIKERTKKKKQELNWSEIQKYKVSIDELPKQEIVSLFK